MLKKLLELEKELFLHLQDEDSWHSVYVDYHKPYVKRLWKQIGENRLYLHQILPCNKNESLLHPHPWPSAMKVVSGTYEMGVGYSTSSDIPAIACTLVLPQDSYYEMADINSWHYVRPLGDVSYSLMLTGKPWNRESPKSSYPLRELYQSEKTMIFNEFKESYDPHI